MGNITKDMVIHQAMRAYPGVAKVFDSHGMGCKSCGGGKVETVGWGAAIHGLDVDAFLRELNNATEGQKTE